MGAFGLAFAIVMPTVFFAIIGGIIMHKLIGMFITGDINAFQAVLIVGVYVGMILSIVTLKLLLAGILLVAMIGLLLLPRLQDRRTLNTLYDQQITQFRAAIESDPGNLAARSRLAETLYKKGDLDEAITEMSEVVRLSPSSREEAYRLKQYMTERDERTARPVTCPSCGRSNPAGRTRCYNCESSLSISTKLVKWLREGGMKEIVTTWVIALAVMTLVMVGLSMLPPASRVLIIGAVLVAGIIFTYVRMHLNSR